MNLSVLKRKTFTIKADEQALHCQSNTRHSTSEEGWFTPALPNEPETGSAGVNHPSSLVLWTDSISVRIHFETDPQDQSRIHFVL